MPASEEARAGTKYVGRITDKRFLGAEESQMSRNIWLLEIACADGETITVDADNLFIAQQEHDVFRPDDYLGRDIEFVLSGYAWSDTYERYLHSISTKLTIVSVEAAPPAKPLKTPEAPYDLDYGTLMNVRVLAARPKTGPNGEVYAVAFDLKDDDGRQFVGVTGLAMHTNGVDLVVLLTFIGEVHRVILNRPLGNGTYEVGSLT